MSACEFVSSRAKFGSEQGGIALVVSSVKRVVWSRMAATTVLEAGSLVSGGSSVCSVLLSRSYCLGGFTGHRCTSPHEGFELHSSKNCVAVGLSRRWQVQALVMEPSDGARENLENFVRRVEQTWSITKQPRPVRCKSCDANGQVDCPWCKGTGFFILGDNMLCEIPSRNTSCRVCFGKGSLPCDDCKGTGFRAKWLGEPVKPKSKGD